MTASQPHEWDDLEAFAEHLDAFASTLSDREREALTRIVLQAMDPLDRVSLRDERDLLAAHEAALLREMEGAPRAEPS
jgi:hypothetical protein